MWQINFYESVGFYKPYKSQVSNTLAWSVIQEGLVRQVNVIPVYSSQAFHIFR